MNENYIMLNGKRVDLTEEQIEKLGLKHVNDPFYKRNETHEYYYINNQGTVSIDLSNSSITTDNMRYKVANYCTDKSIMQQRALHETLDRLLWRFSMQNDGDKLDWSSQSKCKYVVFYEYQDKIFKIDYFHSRQYQGMVYFCSANIAQRAIDEIILPFMKEHPEFVW